MQRLQFSRFVVLNTLPRPMKIALILAVVACALVAQVAAHACLLSPLQRHPITSINTAGTPFDLRGWLVGAAAATATASECAVGGRAVRACQLLFCALTGLGALVATSECGLRAGPCGDATKPTVRPCSPFKPAVVRASHRSS